MIQDIKTLISYGSSRDQQETAAVSKHPILPSEIRAVPGRGITAHFGGEKEYGVSALWFTFAGDETIYVFKPTGDLDFSSWTFDIFSPDGAYVLLQQDHHGPFHLISVERLKAYLQGKAQPDKVIQAPPPRGYEPGQVFPAQVHKFIRWSSDRSFEFSGSCCADEMRYIYDISTGKIRLLYRKPVQPRKNHPWEGKS